MLENQIAISDYHWGALTTHLSARFGRTAFMKGAEVGVRHGDNAVNLLNALPNLRLYLIDSYLPYLDVNYQFTAEEQDAIRIAAQERMSQFGDRIAWIIDSSIKAADGILFESLDFVFIDGCHARESVRRDIEAWWPKVRPGGILSGHDWQMEGVREAVREFGALIKADELNCYSAPAYVWTIEKEEK